MKHIKVVGGKSGAKTRVYIDGKAQGRVHGISWEVNAQNLMSVTIKVYPETFEIVPFENGFPFQEAEKTKKKGKKS